MKPLKPQTIIFDFGGVLLDWNPRHLYRRFFDRAEQIDEFLTEINFNDWNVQQDKGRPFAEGVAELCAKFPEYAPLIRAYRERWEDSVAGPINGSIEILLALKNAGYPVYGLSNWSAETFPIAYKKFTFFQLLDGFVISGDVGLVKPDPAIFDLLLRKIGRPANQCVLIDDSPHNIAAAQKLGFETILFQSPAQLKLQLQRMQLLPMEVSAQ